MSESNLTIAIFLIYNYYFIQKLTNTTISALPLVAIRIGTKMRDTYLVKHADFP